METWKDVVGNDLYQVSDMGRVRRSKPGRGAHVGRILTPHFSDDGYLAVRLYFGGRNDWKEIKVHRLVASAFICPSPFDGAEVNHKNGTRSDNRQENLEWVSRSQNLFHAIHQLSRFKPMGERHGNSKLTNEIVSEMRSLYATGEWTQTRIAKRFGITQATVWRVIRHVSWTHID